MALLKEDGSLDIERINKLPREERMREIGSFTREQFQEYLSKIPLNEGYTHTFYLDLKASDFGLNESRSKNIIRLTSSDLKHIITESVQRILQEQESKVGKRLGEYEVIDGRFASCKAPSLERFGYYNDVRMYYSPCHTYCLMRREDNGTLFFAEIVTAPELGKNQTKYVPRKPNEVPSFILRDAQSLLRKAKNQRIMIS